MIVEIPQQYDEFNRFLSEERSMVFAYLRKTVHLNDDDIKLIYKQSATVLLHKIEEGDLSVKQTSLSSCLLEICNNNALTFIKDNTTAFKRFISKERDVIFAYLHNAFNLDDTDMDDIYQESSVALYLNINEGKLSHLTSSLSTYFLRLCINQTLKFLSKKKRTVPLTDQMPTSTKEEFMADKIDELYHLSTEDISDDERSYSERIVHAVLVALPETCRNIFKGYYWNNFDNNTIADAYGFANANSVKSQKYKCVSKFKEKYKELIRKHYE